MVSLRQLGLFALTVAVAEIHAAYLHRWTSKEELLTVASQSRNCIEASQIFGWRMVRNLFQTARIKSEGAVVI
jgi:hypothetical protein